MNLAHKWICGSRKWKQRLGNEIIPWALSGVELGENILEVGPGPGLTTDILRERYAAVTAIEIDARAARLLEDRLRGTNVEVFNGDAANMPFEDASFSGAVSFTMLHHIPSAELQDRMLAEVCRVLRPGAIFAGTDSRLSRMFRLLHLNDTMTVVDPDSFESRLHRAGFADISIKLAERAFRFRATRARS